MIWASRVSGFIVRSSNRGSIVNPIIVGYDQQSKGKGIFVYDNQKNERGNNIKDLG